MTGASGNLGTEIRKLTDIIAPSLEELDITSAESCKEVIEKYNPDIILHAAAYTDVAGAQKDKKVCWDVNVVGTEHIARAAGGRRLIYISTDYVFDGEQGDYKENDTPNPVNFYALTKLAGELIIKQYPHTLIIRTAFKPIGPWKYPQAFVDQTTSHDFVDRIAPKILNATLMTDLEGTIHIAGETTTMYDLARRVSPDVGKMSIKDVATHIPPNTSLNQDTWNTLSKQSQQSE